MSPSHAIAKRRSRDPSTPLRAVPLPVPGRNEDVATPISLRLPKSVSQRNIVMLLPGVLQLLIPQLA